MNDGVVMTLGSDAFLIAAKLAGPLLGCALLVGVVVSLLQAATQVQEMTLTFVPKIVVIGLAIPMVAAMTISMLGEAHSWIRMLAAG